MISNRCIYALLAMLELSKRPHGDPVKISEIAREQQIPVRFLEAILRDLKQGGFTTSVRGKDGGYLLALDPGQIRAGDVIRYFEGPMLDAEKTALENVQAGGRQVLTNLMGDAANALERTWDGKSFKDLVDEEQELRQKFVANYSI
jgi:Rrf2 family protein